MSHITEEGIGKDDSSEHISSLTGTHTHTQSGQHVAMVDKLYYAIYCHLVKLSGQPGSM